jgi:hypothetical protein
VPAHTKPHRQEDRQRVSTELHRKQGQRIGRQQGTRMASPATAEKTYQYTTVNRHARVR